ncbi:MAG: DNA-processing protein DprA [Nitrospirales bacterium]|nr:DNA-processing protein DprA [Nitrospirales bacterium]
MNASLQEWLELRAVKGLGPKLFVRLLDIFGSPQAIRSASRSRLVAEGEISSALAQALHQPPSPETQRQIHQELEAVQAGQFSLLPFTHPGYPAKLKTIPDPPAILAITGNLLPQDYYALAIVGARKASAHGRAFTQKLSGDLAALGFTIVSGLARGTDGVAHEGAMASCGRTLAVLGCGIDHMYPPEHRSLRRKIEEQGAVLSEFPMGTPPHAYHFPQRNRVISGLALGVIVTEATSKSGSLITARLALEQNREVFAVPGNVNSPLSRGPHFLIKQGAKLVEDVPDILEEILPILDPEFQEHLKKQQLTVQGTSPQVELGTEEQQVLQLIPLDPVSLDDLISQSAYSSSEVMSILLSLEIKGLIKQISGLQYLRVPFR